jgi:hypothetical protein
MRKTSFTVVAVCVTLLWVGTVHADRPNHNPFQRNPTLVCQQSKLTAQGARNFCLALNSANILAGKPDNSAACQNAFTAALGQIDKVAAEAGTACRYVDNGVDANGDDTVSDLDTGLMWEKQTGTVGGTSTNRIDDVNNTYSWCNGSGFNCANPPNDIADGTAFTVFLATLNNGTSTNGGTTTLITGCFYSHCDWRLPSIVELQGIVDATQGSCGGGSGPCIDPIFGPTQSDSHWSATATAGSPIGAWGVNFDNGFVSDGNRPNDLLYVGAVRSGL